MSRLLLLVRSHLPCKATTNSIGTGAALTLFSLAQTVRDTALRTVAGAGLQKGEAKGMDSFLHLYECVIAQL